MITRINEFKVYMINEASYDQLQIDMVDSNKIDQSVFDDVKNNIQKSAYGTWLLKMIISDIILSEDVYKYKEYFDIFDRNKNSYTKKDIFQYKTKDDLSLFLNKTLEIKDKESTDTSSIKGVSKDLKYKQYEIGSVAGFTVYELKDEDDYGVSCDLGSGTEWCTATGKDRSYFDKYIQKDSLFIFIKGNEKYQFHYKDKQFMDKNDVSIIEDKEYKSKKYIYDLFKFIQDKYPRFSLYKIPQIVKIVFLELDKLDLSNFEDSDWFKLSKYKTLTEDFIRDFSGKLDWFNISRYQVLSESFIREFKDKLNWFNISRYQFLSEGFIKEFSDELNWAIISEFQELSESFMREFKDKVDWLYISIYQKLSEEFIREFKDKINWIKISQYQILSEEFIREFQDNVYWPYIEKNQKLSNEFKEEFLK